MAARRGSIVLVLLAALAILAGTAATLLSGRKGAGGGPLSILTEGPGPAASRGHPAFDRNREPSRPATFGVLVLRHPERTPVAAARVVLFTGPGRIEGTTNADGRASFADALSGQARLDTLADGFEPDQRGADIRPGENATVEVLLMESAVIEGRVIAAADGAPIAGATVAARRWPDFARVEDPAAAGMQAVTDEAGLFRLRAGRPGGEVLLDARADGFAPESSAIRIPHDRACAGSAVIRLSRMGHIRGTVRDVRGVPIEGAAVRAMTKTVAGAWHPIGATSGPDGAYAIEGLAVDAVYQVRTLGWTTGRQQPGRPPMSNVVDVHLPAVPGEATVDLLVPGVGTLVVDWADASGHSDGTARCLVFPLEGSAEAVENVSNSLIRSGALHVLSAGRYRVVVGSTRYGVGEAEAVVIADAEARVRVVVGTGPALEGIVVDDEGRPVAGALVRALHPGEAPGTEAPDPPENGSSASIRFQRVLRDHQGAPGALLIHSATLIRGAGVADALLGGLRSRTDEAGRFRIDDVRPGTSWHLYVRESELAVEPTGPFDVPTKDIRLVAQRCGALQGRLFLPAGAAVPATRSIHFESATAVSHAEPTLRTTGGFGDGSFRIEGLPPGKGRLWADSESGFLEPVEVVVPAGDSADLGSLPMQPAHRLFGRVVRTSGTPVDRARVDATGAAESVRTNDDGSFSIGGLRSGEVVVRVDQYAYGPPSTTTERRITLETGGGETGPIEIEVSSPGVLDGTARDAEGRPLAGWRLRARRAGEAASASFAIGSVTHRGMFEIWLDPGEWVVTLHAPGSREAAAEATVTIPEDGVGSVDFRLEPK